MAQPVSEEKVLEILGVMPMSRRELAREFGVPWQDGTLNAVLMALLRTKVIDLVGGSYPERWRLTKENE
jgi:hypothetical protein